jgi:hypothetical protein
MCDHGFGAMPQFAVSVTPSQPHTSQNPSHASIGSKQLIVGVSVPHPAFAYEARWPGAHGDASTGSGPASQFITQTRPSIGWSSHAHAPNAQVQCQG